MNFKDKLKELINSCSKENGSDTPDWILAKYLDTCLKAFDITVNARDVFRTRKIPFHINGKKYLSKKWAVSYECLVKACGKTGTPSVTYKTSRCQGVLNPGESLSLTDDCRVYIVHTGAA